MYTYRYIHGPHSPVDGQLDWPRVLAFVNSAAMNTRCMHPFGLCFPPGICPGVGLQSHMVALFLVS